MSLLWKVLKVFLVVVVIVAGIAAYFGYRVFYGPNEFDGVEKKSFFVSRGQTWAQVVDSLDTQGIIRSKEWFVFVTRILNRGTATHIGKYEFDSGISNVDLYNKLRQGKDIVPIAVTFREGRRSISYARAVRRVLSADSARFMSFVESPTFAESLGINAPTLEGYLAPNTYFFNWQTDEEEIVRRLVRQTTQRIFSDSLLKRAEQLNLTMHEVLTLASIVEGEAALDEERATIAGVYHNRLRKGMRLEADPTVQYIIPDGPRRLLYSDLQIRSPYNTYRNLGLPPGPINNPQVKSIEAVLWPENHRYIFFVADGRGGHWFATSYAGHLENVRRFRRERAERQNG